MAAGVDPEHERESDGYIKEVLGVPAAVAYLVRRRIRADPVARGASRTSELGCDVRSKIRR
jgi:hypothetical protein